FHLAGEDAPNILFFHGNGEIVADYDPVGPLYNDHELSFLAVDYRGYGRSGGMPSVTAMMHDAHVVFKEIRAWLKEENRNGPFLVMGRSLGSACAVDLAASYEEDIAGLIIESGFALTVPLLTSLGIDTQALGITEADGFRNLEKIAQVAKPTLIMHARYDQIIPATSAELLQVHCAARSKEFHMIPGADHNTIISHGGRFYFEIIKRFTNKIEGKRPKRSYKERRKASRERAG
ncbi:MAG: alpha/beta fold hydrolase, partial [Thermodesulfobacteriota bacterium]|nr:alpha/beta fold hydrolase [Thermodesulfobacteriota bacterium]